MILMPRQIVEYFPVGDACKICGSKMEIYYDLPNYRTAYCPKCGYWDYFYSNEDGKTNRLLQS